MISGSELYFDQTEVDFKGSVPVIGSNKVKVSVFEKKLIQALVLFVQFFTAGEDKSDWNIKFIRVRNGDGRKGGYIGVNLFSANQEIITLGDDVRNQVCPSSWVCK